MAWRAPTEDDLLRAITDAELTAYRAAATRPGQTDPVTASLAGVVAYVRDFIRSNPNNRLGATGTLPEGLIMPAMDYLAVDVIKRLPGRKIDAERSKARTDAQDLFKDVRTGTHEIEQPTELSTDQGAQPSPNVPERTHYWDRASQDGV